MLRVSDETRDRIKRLAQDEFGGASANEVVEHLLDEHWEAAALAAVARTAAEHPHEWTEYLEGAEEFSKVDASISDEWSPR